MKFSGNYRSSRGSNTVGQNAFLGVLLIVAISAVVYSLTVMKDQYTVKPDKQFEKYFTNSFSSLSNLTTGGQISSESDIWMTFNCSGILRFRDNSIWHTDSPVRAQRWFLEHFEQDQTLKNTSDLDAWSFSQHPNSIKLVNGWLLVNKKTGKNYFREWGTD